MSKPRDDGTYTINTPNQLLLRQSSKILPDDAELVEDLPVTSRYRIIHHVTESFWKRWSSEVTPGLIHRQKWHKKGRNLRVKDVVMICAPTKVKGKYRLAIVDDVNVSSDGCVRSATVRYSSVRSSQGKDTLQTVRVKRSVQRLCIILPVEEQTADVDVKEHDFYVECTTQN